MARQLTIRGVPEEVSRRLASLGRTRGESLNTVVRRILEQAVDVDARQQRLSRYATWTAEDLADFQRALTAQRGIDAELWR
jgi:plasmid stability protein